MGGHVDEADMDQADVDPVLIARGQERPRRTRGRPYGGRAGGVSRAGRPTVRGSAAGRAPSATGRAGGAAVHAGGAAVCGRGAAVRGRGTHGRGGQAFYGDGVGSGGGGGDDGGDDGGDGGGGCGEGGRIPILEPFLNEDMAGPKGEALNVDPTSLDHLLLYFTEEMFDLTVAETNRYAEQYLDNAELTPGQRANTWRPVSKEEIKVFFGLHMLSGQIDNIANFENIQYFFI